MTTDSPLAIYQRHLDMISEALWARDYDVLTAAMDYPHQVNYGGTVTKIETPDVLATRAISVRDQLEAVGASAYLRVCTAAQFDVAASDRIIGSHTTFVLKGGGYIVPPYAGRMTLVRRDGRWLGVGISTDVDPAAIQLT